MRLLMISRGVCEDTIFNLEHEDSLLGSSPSLISHNFMSFSVDNSLLEDQLLPEATLMD